MMLLHHSDSWSLACSYCLFTEVSQDLVLGGLSVNTCLYGCGLIQVVSDHSVKRRSVSSLVLLSSGLALKYWIEMLCLCVFSLITDTVQLNFVSPMPMLNAPCALGYFTLPVFSLLGC
jgi:hypothetical protein